MMPTSCHMFYEFINDLGDLQGITMMALYADIRVYQNMIDEQAEEEELKEQAVTIMKDYVLEFNTYQMGTNDITRELRRLYVPGTDEIREDLREGKLFDELFDFCMSGLEVYYAVFKKSDRFEQLKEEVDRQEIMYHVLRKYNLISN
mmetsp:Transcript_43268/g.57244  ORF Transcript_43268/g.57244 Transcript_43268/m.57244 type:complete len:147 (+) Transcript_43268:1210-1650(+)